MYEPRKGRKTRKSKGFTTVCFESGSQKEALNSYWFSCHSCVSWSNNDLKIVMLVDCVSMKGQYQNHPVDHVHPV